MAAMKLLAVVFVVINVVAAAVQNSVDTNHDGRISNEEELEMVDRLYSSLDIDLDGGISPEEMHKESSDLPTNADTDGNIKVSRKELRAFWMDSKTRDWDETQIKRWLENIGLIQYAAAFEKGKVTGRMLPLFAMDNGRLLERELAVTDPVHRNLITVAILREVFGVPTLSGPASHTLEIVLGLVSVLVAGVAYFYSQKMQEHSLQRQQLADRLREAEDAARNTESMLGKRLAELAKAASSTETELSLTHQKVDSIKQDQQMYEVLYNREKDCREKLMVWLRDKFAMEAKKFAESWGNINKRLIESHSDANQILSNTSFFSKSTRSMEHRTKLEQLDQEIRKWRSNYRSFLQQWIVVNELGLIDQPDLMLQLNDLDKQMSQNSKSNSSGSSTPTPRLDLH